MRRGRPPDCPALGSPTGANMVNVPAGKACGAAMKLYSSKFAPNPRRVRIFLSEKGLSVPTVDVDLVAFEHKAPGYAALNPFRRVPCLELDDGEILAESIAICRYFEALHPSPSLFGEGARGQAFVEMWQRRLELNLLANVAAVFRHSHPAMKEWEVPQIPDFAAASRPRALEAMAIADRALQGRAFIAGDQFSVADITGLVALDFAKPARIDIPAELADLRRWHAALASRPSAKA